MSLPTISIVIPSYNQGQFIEETLKSIIDQQYPKLQLVVIDGGSTDNSVQIIKKYEKHLHYWISEKDNGQSHAINKGFALCTGQLLSFLNSDDLLLPNSLQRIAERYQNKNEIITGPILEGHDVKRAIEKSVIKPLTIDNFLLNIGLFGQPGTFWTANENKIQLNEDLHFCLDFEFFYRLLLAGYKINALETPLAFFRKHENAKTSKLQILKHKEIIAFLQSNMHRHCAIELSLQKISARTKRTLLRLELLETWKNDKSKLLMKIWEAFLYDPKVFIKGI